MHSRVSYASLTLPSPIPSPRSPPPGHRFTPNIEESQRIRNAIPLENNQRFEVLFAEAKEREAKIRALREDEELSFKTLSQKEAKQAIDKK